CARGIYYDYAMDYW
nr:immunoglobulin heavy chain junction region [Mus musculus]